MVILSTFFVVSNLVSTLIPLDNFGTFFSRIKMYTLFPLHQSAATTNLIFLSQIRLLPLYRVSGNHLFRLFDCSVLLVVVVSKRGLFPKLSSRLFSHYGSLVWTQLLIEATSTVYLLGSGSSRRTTIRSPLMRLLIS